jgi:hypothetical protein
MKTLQVRKEIFEDEIPGLEEISATLDKQGRGHFIDTINWKEYQYRPDVRFNIAYSDREILLKYYIKEKYFKAEKTTTNQMVCEDSCVEFFISPPNDSGYYNFEFNAIGTCLLGTGTCRTDRLLAPAEIISKIRRMTSPQKKPVKDKNEEFIWTITIAIPKEVFFHHEIEELTGKTFRANFYKCGDKLPEPHYITWNPVGTPEPDFHQPGFFGLLKFMPYHAGRIGSE